MKNYGCIPLPIEHTRARSRWPRVSARIVNRTIWCALGFFVGLTFASVLAGILPLPK